MKTLPQAGLELKAGATSYHRDSVHGAVLLLTARNATKASYHGGPCLPDVANQEAPLKLRFFILPKSERKAGQEVRETHNHNLLNPPYKERPENTSGPEGVRRPSGLTAPSARRAAWTRPGRESSSDTQKRTDPRLLVVSQGEPEHLIHDYF